MHASFFSPVRPTVALACAAALAPAAAIAQFAEPDVSVLYTLTSDQANDGYGFVAEAIGDLNGDGASEIAVGAVNNTEGGAFAGAAFIYSGRDGTLLHKVKGSFLNFLGHSVAGAGDVDNDGVPDYAVSGRGVGGTSGRLLVISGATHTTIIDRSGTTPGGSFGYDIDAAGDINGDGRPDLIVGAPLEGAAGTVHFVSGKDGATLRSIAGPGAGSKFGSSVSRVADQNSDGTADHAVGAPDAGKPKEGGPAGEAYVLSGRDGSVIRVLKARHNSGREFGNFFIHDAGDVNGDGRGDIFVPDYADDTVGPFAGLAYVFLGGCDNERRIIRPQVAGGGFGPGRGAGDVNEDGHDDLVVAAFVSSEGAPQGGKMFVISGRTGKTLRTMTGTVAGVQLGFDALAVGDVNGDRHIDFLITGLGVAHLILGRP
jgi:hypothetical protein